MANEIKTTNATGKTIYAVLRNAADQVWNTSTPAFESYSGANYTHYAVALTEQGATGFYAASLPAAIVTAGKYAVDLRLQAGGTPATTDTPIAAGSLVWNGSAEVFVTANAFGQVQADLAQAVPTSNTAQTVGDAFNAARAVGFGKWTLAGTTLALYAADGTTIVRTFTLDNANNPTTRV